MLSLGFVNNVIFTGRLLTQAIVLIHFLTKIHFLTDWDWQKVTGWYSISDFIASWTCKLLLGWNNWDEINLSDDIRIQSDSVQISYRTLQTDHSQSHRNLQNDLAFSVALEQLKRLLTKRYCNNDVECGE